LKDEDAGARTALPVMKQDVPARALATTSSCSALSWALVPRRRASMRLSWDAPSEPMTVSSLFAPRGLAPRRIRSATETLAFFF
jgi:hypothetical protein